MKRNVQKLYSGMKGKAGFWGQNEKITPEFIYPMSSSILEGVNNRIKVIKRMAYGFRDASYFFLKIKDAFPGKA
ncbi:transposase [Massilia sp. GER05]|uniref:transposase n=1 Tax=Massilia sp. GER05 TaxID=3394605 RepID=UPI003F85CA6C